MGNTGKGRKLGKGGEQQIPREKTHINSPPGKKRGLIMCGKNELKKKKTEFSEKRKQGISKKGGEKEPV